MNYSLSKKFILLSFTAFVITGLLISFFVTNHIKTDKLNNIQESTLLTLDTILTPKLIPNDFQSFLAKSRTVSLNETLNNIIRSSNILGIRIWNTESEEILSTTIPISYSSGKEFSQALNGKIRSNILDMDGEQQPGRKTNEVIQIFSPIILDQKIVGVYEVYTSYDIKSHRIIAVADTYDAMTSDRPYRKGLTSDVALKEIQRCAGTQFDPTIVEAFMKINFRHRPD